MTSLDLSGKCSYSKHVCTLWGPQLTVSFTSLKLEFNPIIIRHKVVSIQLSTVNNIFKATVLQATQEIVKYYLEYRKKTYIKAGNS